MNSNNQSVTAIIVAAGKSQRMGGRDKMRTLLAGKPVLLRTIEAFEKCPAVNRIVVVLNKQNLEYGKEMVRRWGWSKVAAVCPGGERRQDSVLAGLKLAGECDWVIIHDGARPLVTDDLIERGLAEAQETGAAVAAVPVTDTIKVAGGDMLVQETPPRRQLWAIQTPQVFRREIIIEAYRQAKNEVTDDASLVEQLGYKVKLYSGAYDNIKITTPHDLAVAEILWQKRIARK